MILIHSAEWLVKAELILFRVTRKATRLGARQIGRRHGSDTNTASASCSEVSLRLAQEERARAPHHALQILTKCIDVLSCCLVLGDQDGEYLSDLIEFLVK